MNYKEAKEVLYSGGKVTIFDGADWYVDYDYITKKATIYFDNNTSYDLRDKQMLYYYEKLKNSNDIEVCYDMNSFSVNSYENLTFGKAIDAMKKGKTIARKNGKEKYEISRISNLEDDYVAIVKIYDNLLDYPSRYMMNDNIPFTMEDMLADDWVIIK